MPDCGSCGADVIGVELDQGPGRTILLDTDTSTGYALVAHRDTGQERALPVFTYQEHHCGNLQLLAELAPLSTTELDELVHDHKGKEAAAIDNRGKVEQLAYLTGVRADVVKRQLEDRELD